MRSWVLFYFVSELSDILCHDCLRHVTVVIERNLACILFSVQMCCDSWITSLSVCVCYDESRTVNCLLVHLIQLTCSHLWCMLFWMLCMNICGHPAWSYTHTHSSYIFLFLPWELCYLLILSFKKNIVYTLPSGIYVLVYNLYLLSQNFRFLQEKWEHKYHWAQSLRRWTNEEISHLLWNSKVRATNCSTLCNFS